MTTIITTDDNDTDEATEDVAEAVDDIAEAVSDAVMDAATISNVERITRLEDTVTVLTGVVENIGEQLQGMMVMDEIQQQEIDRTQAAVAEVASETADAVTDVVEDIEQATEPESEAGSDVEPDEVPSVRDHPFFRKWGRR